MAHVEAKVKVEIEIEAEVGSMRLVIVDYWEQQVHEC